MNLLDYLLEQKGQDWAAILTEWHWLVPRDLTVWMVNRFGDIFFVPEDGSIQLLDIGAGSVKQLAANREDFYTQVAIGDNADNWFLISLTDKCVASGLMLGPGQCYAFKSAPIFGGEYSVENIEIMDLAVNYSLMAQIHEQIRDLPDGAQVKLVLGA